MDIVENLINRNKELEEIEKAHQEENGKIREQVKKLEEENRIILNSKVGVDLSYDDYIPKSVIKEKIEELNNRIEKYREYTEQGIETDVEWVDNVADRETLSVLEELLEKEK